MLRVDLSKLCKLLLKGFVGPEAVVLSTQPTV
jgi:hypothetical protein